MSKRKICIVTGTRAEYGLLYWLMKEIQLDSDLELQVAVTGMHLSPEFGLTYRVIEEDGFSITEKIEILLSGDSPAAVTKSLGLGVLGFADAFARLTPDVVVVLGDRYEILAAAQAALIARIPVAHIHGGETTEGAFDDAIRHAITKMSHIHFVASEPYRKRVIQLGENPAHVLNYGAPGLDNFKRLRLLERTELERALDFTLDKQAFLVTYHPVTLKSEGPETAFRGLLEALDSFPDTQVIFTYPNSDTDGRIIRNLIDEYVLQSSNRCKAYASLGQLRYLSAIRHVDAIIGNSSSGIIEAPLFQKPTVNIGNRQTGRLKAASIIDCEESSASIVTAIQHALSRSFREKLGDVKSLYGGGDACSKMKDYLKRVRLDGIVVKKFHDIECGD